MLAKFVLPMTMALITTAAFAGPRADLLGNPAPEAAATRTIDIARDARYVNVTSGEIVRFRSGDRSFTWNFSGPQELSSGDLGRTAPQGFLNRPVHVYVAPSTIRPDGGV